MPSGLPAADAGHAPPALDRTGRCAGPPNPLSGPARPLPAVHDGPDSRISTGGGSLRQPAGCRHPRLPTRAGLDAKSTSVKGHDPSAGSGTTTIPPSGVSRPLGGARRHDEHHQRTGVHGWWCFVSRPCHPRKRRPPSLTTYRPGLAAGRDAQALHRAATPEFSGWLEHTRPAGGCARPIRLTGTIATVDRNTGRIPAQRHTDELPDRTLYKACGNRRESAARTAPRSTKATPTKSSVAA